MIAVGLMSGTSLDGIDAALVSIVPRGDSYALEVLGFATTPFDAAMRSRLGEVLPPQAGSVERVAELHRALGEAFAAAATGVLQGAKPGYAASHGQTVWHDGTRHVTLQIGDAFAIRSALSASVCYDFRSADCVAGGEGAPLVPYVDRLLFSDEREDRVAVNLGGIANVTALPSKASRGPLVAFDTGPGNMLIDAFVRERTEGAHAYDAGGSWAARGEPDATLLVEMLSDDYFSLPHPKSTGRERFGAQFLRRFSAPLERLGLEDGCATLVELTALSLARAIERLPLERPRVVAGGGGVHNAALMRAIARALPQSAIDTTAAFGIPPDAKEALAFAVLGYETLRGRVANVPEATGAREGAPLGAIAPYRLHELLEEVERECRGAS